MLRRAKRRRRKIVRLPGWRCQQDRWPDRHAGNGRAFIEWRERNGSLRDIRPKRGGGGRDDVTRTIRHEDAAAIDIEVEGDRWIGDRVGSDGARDVPRLGGGLTQELAAGRNVGEKVTDGHRGSRRRASRERRADLAEFDVKNRLLAVPGVAAVERLGGYLRQFQVQLDPDRMSARRVSLDEVMHAVESSNVNASGGFVRQGPMEWSVRAVGRAGSSEDLRGTVVAVRGDTPVLRSTEPAELASSRLSGCYPLAPYSNRLGYRRFRWQGRDYTTEPNFDDNPHSVHGMAWQRPWTVAASEAARATLRRPGPVPAPNETDDRTG